MDGIFKCSGDDYEVLPQELIESYGIEYPKAHYEKEQMQKLALAFKAHKNDGLVKVPFCVTVEAEALGARIKLGDARFGPRVESYVIDTPSDMQTIGDTLNTQRQDTIINVIEELSETETVVLAVTGPFTVASSLIEPRVFYKWLRKSPEDAVALLEEIEAQIVEFAIRGVQAGAKIISFADPVGGVDIVGPNMYEKHSGPASHRVVSEIQRACDNVLIHLCGKTSVGFESVGLCEMEKHTGYEGTYGEAFMTFQEEGGTRILGHRCIKTASNSNASGTLFEVKLIG